MSQYDVFISYSSADRPWAERLYDGLVGRGLAPFFDKSSLRDGDGWEKQLEHGLRNAEHMVCLWSGAAYDSEWVQNELGSFRSSLLANKGASKLLIVRLDDRRNTFGSTQQIDVAEIKAAYADQALPLHDTVWSALIDRVAKALRQALATVEIPLVLLTLTKEQACGIGGVDRATLQKQLGLDDAALADRYGTGPRDWRPFGTATTIGTILDRSRDELNRWLAPESMSWDAPGENFWTDTDAAREFARRMANGKLGAIVIDPVAMLVADVQSKLGLFTACLHCENVAIIAVPTTPAPEQDGRLRGWLGKFAATLFNDYLEPPQLTQQMPHARYGVGLGDAGEVRRLLQRSVGDFLRKARKDAGPRNPITGF